MVVSIEKLRVLTFFWIVALASRGDHAEDRELHRLYEAEP
jgi:hypothetical protein